VPEPGDPLTSRKAAAPGETRYRALFEALPDGLLVVDDAGFCVDANPSLCTRLGRPGELLLGARLADLALPERADSVARAFERLKVTGVLSGEIPLAATDGSP